MNREELDVYLRKPKINEDPAFQELSKNFHSDKLTFDLKIFTDTPGESIKIYPHGRYTSVPEHSHDYFEMMYIYDGCITQTVEGEKLKMNRGAVCLLDLDAKHSIEECGENDIGMNFIMQKEFLDAAFFSHTKNNSLFSEFFANSIHHNSSFPRYIFLDTGDAPQVRNYAEMIMCEYFDPDLCSDGTIESLIPALFNELFRVWRLKGGKKILREPDESKSIWKILRYIQTNCAEATLTTTAHRFGYSPNYLSTLISKATGSSFTEIKHKECMNQASLMLLNTDMSVIDVAQSVGFSNITHFYTIFRKSFGLTPADFREKKKKS
ncbi:MAG: AraC family transcriptional regulator [Eubacteriales bacterium]